jgi:hypothetical protein
MMKKTLYFLYAILSVTLLYTSCTKQPVENEPPDNGDDAYGYWLLSIPPVPTMTTDTMNIVLDIDSDGTFILELNERFEKTLYHSEGEWSATDDSIILVNSTCQILDTVPDPDTLSNLADSICSQPIPLPHPQSEDEWVVQTKSLETLMLALIDESLLETLLLVIPVAPLEKQEE